MFGGLEVVGHVGQLVGYVRVSTLEQNPARQLQALGRVDKLFQDAASGAGRERPQLGALLEYVRDGDVMRVKSPDRLARSTTDLLQIVGDLKERGVSVEFVDNPSLNTDTPQGEFMLTILAAVAQLERATIKERQAEGIALAKQRGVYERAPKLDQEQVAEVRQLVGAGIPKARIARDLGVSRQTLYTALAGKGRYGGWSEG